MTQGETAARPVLAVQGIVKEFPGVRALDGVDLELRPGEVHALVGENGAGKSTLMKVLAGIHAPDAGQLLLDGRITAFDGPHAAIAAGILTIHQELALVAPLTVAQNIALGREPRAARGIPGALDRTRMDALANDAMKRLGARIHPRRTVGSLGVAQRQLVEIARALVREARVIIMDEPTASLSAAEASSLLRVIGELRDHGVAIAFISHRLDDVFAVADRVTVLRDGRSVWSGARTAITPEALITAMVGRELKEQYPSRAATTGPRSGADAGAQAASAGVSSAKGPVADAVLRVEGLTRAGTVQDVSFCVRAGEVVGLAGLIGAGRTEVARIIAGADPADAGRIFVDGRPYDPRNPRAAIEAGIAYLSEDRKTDGLVLTLNVTQNVGLTSTTRQATLAPLDLAGMRRTAQRYVTDLAIKTASLETRVETLSGGTQQKVLLARCMTSEPRVIIVDEPTRGIDVGARVEIYAQINALARAGKAVLLISSDLPEILGMSDRVLVMSEGRLTAELDRRDATSERVMAAALPASRTAEVEA